MYRQLLRVPAKTPAGHICLSCQRYLYVANQQRGSQETSTTHSAASADDWFNSFNEISAANETRPLPESERQTRRETAKATIQEPRKEARRETTKQARQDGAGGRNRFRPVKRSNPLFEALKSSVHPRAEQGGGVSNAETAIVEDDAQPVDAITNHDGALTTKSDLQPAVEAVPPTPPKSAFGRTASDASKRTLKRKRSKLRQRARQRAEAEASTEFAVASEDGVDAVTPASTRDAIAYASSGRQVGGRGSAEVIENDQSQAISRGAYASESSSERDRFEAIIGTMISAAQSPAPAAVPSVGKAPDGDVEQIANPPASTAVAVPARKCADKDTRKVAQAHSPSKATTYSQRQLDALIAKINTVESTQPSIMVAGKNNEKADEPRLPNPASKTIKKTAKPPTKKHAEKAAKPLTAAHELDETNAYDHPMFRLTDVEEMEAEESPAKSYENAEENSLATTEIEPEYDPATFVRPAPFPLSPSKPIDEVEVSPGLISSERTSTTAPAGLDEGSAQPPAATSSKTPSLEQIFFRNAKRKPAYTPSPDSPAGKAQVARDRPKWGGVQDSAFERATHQMASYDTLRRADRVTPPTPTPKTAFTAKPWGVERSKTPSLFADTPGDLAEMAHAPQVTAPEASSSPFSTSSKAKPWGVESSNKPSKIADSLGYSAEREAQAPSPDDATARKEAPKEKSGSFFSRVKKALMGEVNAGPKEPAATEIERAGKGRKAEEVTEKADGPLIRVGKRVLEPFEDTVGSAVVEKTEPGTASRDQHSALAAAIAHTALDKPDETAGGAEKDASQRLGDLYAQERALEEEVDQELKAENAVPGLPADAPSASADHDARHHLGKLNAQRKALEDIVDEESKADDSASVSKLPATSGSEKTGRSEPGVEKSAFRRTSSRGPWMKVHTRFQEKAIKRRKQAALRAAQENASRESPRGQDAVVQGREDAYSKVEGTQQQDVVPTADSNDGVQGRSLWEVMQGSQLSEAFPVNPGQSQQSPAEPSDAVPVDEAVEEAPENIQVDIVDAKDLEITALDIPQPPVPNLAYGLDRVLFNSGVYQLQDPHSRVYNFDPYLEKIMPVTEFDFNALKEYKTSSEDTMLSKLASEHGKKYVGSTSSMTYTLSHFHYLLSDWRDLNLDMLSRNFPETSPTFTAINRAPTAMFLRYKPELGTYAIDADKEHDSGNVLMMLGKSMEKLLTLDESSYERYRKSDPRQVSAEEREEPEAYQYTTMGDFLMRSQLDAYDSRLPGTGMFDIKTRSVLSIRMNTTDFEPMLGYELSSLQGKYNSYEREYYDMMRSTLLKYMLQARMGRMDGIFLAYHNVERMFGFQYLPMREIDRAIHGQVDPCLGDQEFKLSLEMLNKVLEMATQKFPGVSLRFHFETRTAPVTAMYVFAEPMVEEEIEEIQGRGKGKVAKFERDMMRFDKEDRPKPFSEVKTESAAGDAMIDSAGPSSASADPAPGTSDGISTTTTSSKPSNQESTCSTTTSDADPSFLSNLSSTSSSSSSDQSHSPLFAATLITASRVNNSRVDRPRFLTPDDDWSVEYILREIEDPADAWAMYAQCKEKRRSTFAKFRSDDEGDGEKREESSYLVMLKELAREGREWRGMVEKAEEGKGKVMYKSDGGVKAANTAGGGVAEQVADAAPTGQVVVGSEEEVDDTESYMMWLYKDR